MKKILIALLCLFFLSPSIRAEEKALSSLSWSDRMQSLSSIIQELLIDSASSERFNSSLFRNRIQKNLNALAQVAHEVDREARQAHAPDEDRSLAFFSKFLREDATRASLAFQSGSLPYARSLIQSTISSCMACHTRTEKGPQFDVKTTGEGWSQLSSFERAELMTVLRHFEPALQKYQSLIRNKNFAAAHPQDWEKSVRQALTLSVRVKNDPATAQKIVDAALANSKLPPVLKGTMTAWKRDILRWRENPEISGDLLVQAERLIDEGARSKLYPADHSADVLYLRATRLVHEHLQDSKDSEKIAPAFLLAGRAYEALDGLGLWSLPEVYYESCINAAPGTDVARSCYQSYEKLIRDSFMGSSGASLPSELKAHLKRLRGKAYR